MSLASAAGAGVSMMGSADAALVQITQVGNFVSSTVGSLSQDLTGDGGVDFFWSSDRGATHVGANYFSYFAALGGVEDGRRRRDMLPLELARVTNAYHVGSLDILSAKVMGTVVDTDSPDRPSALLANGLIRLFSLNDANINGGAATNALIEIIASSDGTAAGTRVNVARIIFDDPNAGPSEALPTSATLAPSYIEFVPEPSSLALLTLGAAGVLARRRRATAN